MCAEILLHMKGLQVFHGRLHVVQHHHPRQLVLTAPLAELLNGVVVVVFLVVRYLHPQLGKRNVQQRASDTLLSARITPQHTVWPWAARGQRQLPHRCKRQLALATAAQATEGHDTVTRLLTAQRPQQPVHHRQLLHTAELELR